MTATRTKNGRDSGEFRTYGRPRRRRFGGWIFALLAILGLITAGAYGLYSVVNEPPERVQRAVYPLPPEYRDTILEAAEAYSVEPTLIAAVIHTESRWEPGAVSPQDAQGLMQITPDTADFIQNNSGITGDFTDPYTNIWMGTWQLSYLEGRYLGDERAMLAAYNSGQGNVDSWLSEPGFDLAEDIPFTETRNYVEYVFERREIYRSLYGDYLNREVT